MAVYLKVFRALWPVCNVEEAIEIGHERFVWRFVFIGRKRWLSGVNQIVLGIGNEE
jgi:hypothetical protein